MEIVCCTFGRYCRLLLLALRHFRCEQVVIIGKKGLYDRICSDEETRYIGELREIMESGILEKECFRFIELPDIQDFWSCHNGLIAPFQQLLAEETIGPAVVTGRTGELIGRNTLRLNITGSTKTLALAAATVGFNMGLQLYEVLEYRIIEFPVLSYLTVDQRYPRKEHDRGPPRSSPGLRRIILKNIRDEDTIGGLTESLGVDRNDVHVALKSLEGDGMVVSRREGRKLFFEITREGTAIRGYLGGLGEGKAL